MSQASILIVDDDELDRYLLRRDLKGSGIEATIFESFDGLDALEFLRAFDENKEAHGDGFPPRIIFLDINMPRATGLEFLDAFAALRAEREDYGVCVILMFTSSVHPEERQRALQHDFVADFVVKGRTDADELREKVLGVLET